MGMAMNNMSREREREKDYDDGEDELMSPTADPPPPLGYSHASSLYNSPGSMGPPAATSPIGDRKEITRRQRIEAEQRRRDELREGYAKLKDVLPITNQKSSKVSLLERGMSPPPFLFKNVSDIYLKQR